MEHLFTLSLLIFLAALCRKEPHETQSIFLENIKTSIKDSMLASDFSNLDFSKAVLSKVDSAGFYFLRVPFNERSIRNDFLPLQTNRIGGVKRGKILHLEGATRRQDDEG